MDSVRIKEKKKFRGYAAYHDFVNSEEFGEFKRGIVDYVVKDYDTFRELCEAMELHEEVMFHPADIDLVKMALDKGRYMTFHATTGEAGIVLVHVGCCHPDYRIVTYGG